MTAWVDDQTVGVPREPTPMTWGALTTLLGPAGAAGLASIDLGGQPDPTLSGSGVYDLIRGRAMRNLASTLRMDGTWRFLRYPVERYRGEPRAAWGPPAMRLPRGLAGILMMPRAAWRVTQLDARKRALLPTFAETFTKDTLPQFLAHATAALAEDWSPLAPPQLVAKFGEWRRATYLDFGRAALQPGALAEFAGLQVARLLAPKLGNGVGEAVLTELSAGAASPEYSPLDGLGKLRAGEWNAGAFLARFGHRGPHEMELSSPRYSETPGELPTRSDRPDDFADLLARLGRLGARPAPGREPEALDRVATDARLTAPYRERLARRVGQMRAYRDLEEAARHGLAAGVAAMRQALVRLGAVSGVGEGVFFLLPEELPELAAGNLDSPRERAEARRAAREAELAIEVPGVVFGE